MGRTIFWFCIISVLFGTNVFPQSADDAESLIVYAEGHEFSVSRSSTVTTYSVQDDDVLGLSIQQGDVVSTEAGTFLEISLDRTGHILKIAENTTFQLKSSGTGRNSDIVVLYGRVRAKVTRLAGNSSFTVRGQNATAGVRGTDFGFDVIARKSAGKSLPVTTDVYCFEGSVEITPSAEIATDAQVPAAGSGSVIIAADEMVSIERKPATVEKTDSVSQPVPIVKKTITTEIREFWEKQPIKADPLNRPAPKLAVAVKPEKQEPEPVKSEPSVATPPPTDTPKEIVLPGSEAPPETQGPTLSGADLKLKNDLVFTSLTMFVSGGVTGAAGLGLFFITPGNGNTSTTKSIGTALMSCAGTLVITGAIAIVKSLLMSGKP